MRMFVAINVPAAERARIWAALAPLRARDLPVRWTAAESIHITLKFLGEVDEARVDELGDRLGSVAGRHPPFDMTMSGVGAFPTLRRPRIWWIGVAPDPRLLALHAAVEGAFEAADFPRDDRPFAPHATVGRASGNSRGGTTASDRDAATEITYSATIPVRTIDLMRSRLGGGPARYERVAVAPLRASGVAETSQ